MKRGSNSEERNFPTANRANLSHSTVLAGFVISYLIDMSRGRHQSSIVWSSVSAERPSAQPIKMTAVHLPSPTLSAPSGSSTVYSVH